MMAFVFMLRCAYACVSLVVKCSYKSIVELYDIQICMM
jgi:hypothetical protein